ncbi:CDP-glycerol glycerophosphotransferase family protein [Lysinibacillus halotolerans]
MDYKVSIVIPAYNAEKTIERAIESVIKQDFENVQIIVVNDGSTDRTQIIVETLQKKYSNIYLINEHSNQGVSASRNKGINLATGQFITFLDADDFYPENIFNKIYDYIIQKQADIFIGNIECFNDVRTWKLSYMKEVFKNKRMFVTTLKETPDIQYSPSVCNKWYKRSLVGNLNFDTELTIGEDLLFNEQCLIKAKVIAIADIIVYKYRVARLDSLSKKTSISFFEELLNVQQKILKLFSPLQHSQELKVICNRQIKFFIDSIFLKCKGVVANINSLANITMEFYNLIYKYIDLPIYEDNIEKNFLVELLKRNDFVGLLKYFNLLLNNSVSKHNKIKKNIFYSYLINYFPNYHEKLVINPKVLSKVEYLKLDGNHLTIKGYAFVRGFNTNQQSKQLILRNVNTDEQRVFNLSNALRTDITYLNSKDNVCYDSAGFSDINLNISEVIGPGLWEVYINVLIDDQYTVQNRLCVPLAEVKNRAKEQYVRINKKIQRITTYYDESKFIKIHLSNPLTPISYIKSKIRKVKRNIRYDLSLIKKGKFKSFIAIILYKLFRKFFRSKHIWLIGERKDTAQDNSSHLFKYIRLNHKNVNAYYVIDFSSKDYHLIKRYKNIVRFGSIKHTLYLLCSDVTINSYVERPNMYTPEYVDILKYYPEFAKNKKVFLQHGVIGVSRVNHVLHKNKLDYDLFITSSNYEKKHIISEFGYNENEVIVTGLPRWDNLDSKKIQKKVLLMPTWRSWIQSSEELLTSEYFRTYIQLLKNPKLVETLKKHDCELVFFPHYQMQKLLSEEKINLDTRIRVVKQGERPVQDLLNECLVLITDYSTVSFDVAYLEKPVIFYQFDYTEFYSKHYNEGPINHKQQLFGPVVENEREVIVNLDNFLIHGNGEEYINKAKLFIEPNLKQHCQRVYSEIDKLLKY